MYVYRMVWHYLSEEFECIRLRFDLAIKHCGEFVSNISRGFCSSGCNLRWVLRAERLWVLSRQDAKAFSDIPGEEHPQYLWLDVKFLTELVNPKLDVD